MRDAWRDPRVAITTLATIEQPARQDSDKDMGMIERRRFLCATGAFGFALLSACRSKSDLAPGWSASRPVKVDQFSYGYSHSIGGDIGFRVEWQDQPAGRLLPVPIRIKVSNRVGVPWEYDTNGRPIESRVTDPRVDDGLDQPRPVYDLLFIGQMQTERGAAAVGVPSQQYVWRWAAQQPVATRMSLGGNETRTLFDFVWQPPQVAYLRGGFRLRFASIERSLSFGVNSHEYDRG